MKYEGIEWSAKNIRILLAKYKDMKNFVSLVEAEIAKFEELATIVKQGGGLFEAQGILKELEAYKVQRLDKQGAEMRQFRIAQEAVALRRRGKTWVDIAARYGMPVHRLKTLLQRNRYNLRNKWTRKLRPVRMAYPSEKTPSPEGESR